MSEEKEILQRFNVLLKKKPTGKKVHEPQAKLKTQGQANLILPQPHKVPGDPVILWQRVKLDQVLCIHLIPGKLQLTCLLHAGMV